MSLDQQLDLDGIILTEAAAGKVKDLVSQQPDENLFLRISVAPGGCSGLRYQLSSTSASSTVTSPRNGVRRPGRHRPDVRPVPDRRHHRLRRHHRGPGLHHRQPERAGLPAPAATASTEPSATAGLRAANPRIGTSGCPRGASRCAFGLG